MDSNTNLCFMFWVIGLWMGTLQAICAFSLIHLFSRRSKSKRSQK